MHQTRENLDIIFRQVRPEDVLKEINNFIEHGYQGESVWEIPYEIPSHKVFDQYGSRNMEGISKDEIRVRFDHLQDQWKKRGDLRDRSADHKKDEKDTVTNGNTTYRRGSHSIFGLLYQYADQILEWKDEEPVCNVDKVLNWNSITLRLGQDLFTTAWLAHKDCQAGKCDNVSQHSFDWPYCIHVDDQRLNSLLQAGTAENHFHLGGSTQAFPLSWASLMNHPNRIAPLMENYKEFEYDLVIRHSGQKRNPQERWIYLLRYAALIRGLLFSRCMGVYDRKQEDDPISLALSAEGNLLSLGQCSMRDHNADWPRTLRDKFICYSQINDTNVIYELVESLRTTFGLKVSESGLPKILDYAMCSRLYPVDRNSYNRLLSGERALLYQCFMLIYKGELSEFEKTLFYIYLLIKSNFRGELVQINKRRGFFNFAQYQDRKSRFYEHQNEDEEEKESQIVYEIEAQRLAIHSSIKDNYIQSLEARMMPGKTSKDMADKIRMLDRAIELSSEDWNAVGMVLCSDSWKHSPHQGKSESNLDKTFYVPHFAKETFVREELIDRAGDLRPRNWKVRDRIEHQAKAIYAFKRDYDTLQERLRGIDACAYEVGCRPETFATEYRFLRDCNYNINKDGYRDNRAKIDQLGITYHAGEDFLDVCDGLRAMDEAIEFLELRNGDRIGHGLALGLNPYGYYERRRWSVYLSKQDYLDNCIWMLYRTLEWNIPLESSYRELLKREARKYFTEIYDCNVNNKNEDCLDLYYQSWHLRGDHPSLYITGNYDSKSNCTMNLYNKYRIGNRKYDTYRSNEFVARLYADYHYSYHVKSRGLDIISVTVGEWYMDLLAKLQQEMIKRIVRKGICIECNPSSNYLIGYFGPYDQHPIFGFNHYLLDLDVKAPQITVSINTDDLGVFDTSLSYEYALVYSAIRRKRHQLGIYNDDMIYDYLEQIRKNGLGMSFRKKKEF